jgi:hypothetical protein
MWRYERGTVAVAAPKKAGTMLAAVVLAIGFAAVLTVTTAKPAHALCVANNLEGNWHNIDSSTNAMTRVTVSFSCGDVVLCDQNGNCTGGTSAWYVHAWGRCHPTDCDWGVRQATSMGDGWIRAIYNFGFKTSYVWLRTYQYYGLTYLRVWVFNDFTPSDGRADYTTDEWMLH